MIFNEVSSFLRLRACPGIWRYPSAFLARSVDRIAAGYALAYRCAGPVLKIPNGTGDVDQPSMRRPARPHCRNWPSIRPGLDICPI